MSDWSRLNEAGRPRWSALAVGAFALLVMPDAPALAQQIPEWTLPERPRLEIGRSGIELYGVRAAGLLSSGNIAIADGGNARILIVSQAGRLVRQFGRKGYGPGEFQGLWLLAVMPGDTLASYDASLHRVSVWTAAGELVRTVPIRQREGRLTVVRAALSPSKYVLTTSASGQAERGLYIERAAVDILDSESGVRRQLEEREWRRQYSYAQAAGITVYQMSFLGEAAIAASGRRIITAPLDSTSVEIRTPEEPRSRSIPLPVTPRPFDRAVVTALRDSLLARTNPARFPGARERIRAVYGDDFPAPDRAPVIRSLLPVGEDVWVELHPAVGEPLTTWLVIDVEGERLAGRLRLPREWRPLGGGDGLLLVLRRDEWDMEHLAVYDLGRVRR